MTTQGRYRPEKLATALLTDKEIDGVIGTSDMKGGEIADKTYATNLKGSVRPPDSLYGALYNVGHPRVTQPGL